MPRRCPGRPPVAWVGPLDEGCSAGGFEGI